jgi:hypothetical protein
MIRSTLQSRPRPIFGPLLLVAIGIVWLLVAFDVIAPPNLGLLFRLWPVALIAVGLELILRPRWPVISNLVAVATVTLAVLAVLFARQLGLPTTNVWLSWAPFAWGSEAGSGRVITETRSVSGFDRVSFTSFGELVIQRGDTPGLTLEAEDNVLPEIITEVRGGTLVIRYAERNGQVQVRPTRSIILTLTVPDLTQLTLSGAGNVRVEDYQGEALQAILSGAGNLEVNGAVQSLDVVLSGAGSFHGADLKSEHATITISGVGNAVVWATQHLDVTLSGVGWVDYYGQPVVSQDGDGLGNLRALGDK